MRRILLGIALILAAIAAPILAVQRLIVDVSAGSAAGVQFRLPGTTTITPTRAGRWYLYHDHETVFDGEVIRQSPGLPTGTRLTMTTATGEEIPLASDRAQITFTTGGTSSVAVAAWDLEPGTHTLTVHGDDLAAIGSLSEMRVAAIITGVLRALGLSGMLLTIGVVLIVFGARGRRATAAAPEERGPVLADR